MDCKHKITVYYQNLDLFCSMYFSLCRSNNLIPVSSDLVEWHFYLSILCKPVSIFIACIPF
jgi:hypothetical protein